MMNTSCVSDASSDQQSRLTYHPNRPTTSSHPASRFVTRCDLLLYRGLSDYVDARQVISPAPLSMEELDFAVGLMRP